MARLQSYEMDRPTPLTPAGFAMLKIVFILTFMHIETLIIFGVINWLEPSFFWTVEIVITLVLLLRLPGGWLNKKFNEAYEMVTPGADALGKVERQQARSVIVKEAV